MIALVTGGAASGKSAFAEDLARGLPGPHWYLATMKREGAEAEARIGKHRRMREGKGFRTIELECGDAMPTSGTVLLEDTGNLLANGWEYRLADILSCPHAVIVGNEVGCDGVRYEGFTADYIGRIGALSREIADRADLVVEVVAGIPQVLKGDAAKVAPWLS